MMKKSSYSSKAMPKMAAAKPTPKSPASPKLTKVMGKK